jgi:hypothetical protein
MGRSARAVAAGLAAWLALCAAGCTPEICGRNSDCPSGLVCTATGSCGAPPAPAGDAGAADADAGPEEIP